MNSRRSFFKRIAKASLAFSVAPGVFKALPASRRVRDVVGVGQDEMQKAFVESFFFAKPIDMSKCGTWKNLEPIVVKANPTFQRLSELAHWESDFKKEFGVGPFDKWPSVP